LKSITFIASTILNFLTLIPMESNNKTQEVKIKKITATGCDEFPDVLAIEEPLETQVQLGKGKIDSVAVTMRTPGNDLELAIGFLFTEGIIKAGHNILKYEVDEANNKVLINLDESDSFSLKTVERNFYTTSSCGVCGKSSIDAIRISSSFSIIDDHTFVDGQTLHGLEKKLLKQQTVFSKTGGLHASALFDAEGNFILLREDVGRHNALDKIIGASFLKNQLPLSNKVLLLSGRASFELIQKAAMAGIPIVASVGAPSSLAVSLAKELGITLIGFLRNDRFNIYCGAERVRLHALV
jgi:FdhD protein